MTRSIFQHPDSRAVLERWYAHFLAKARIPTESRRVSTRFGETHVLLAGPPEAPPLVVLHGALASSAHAICEVEPLARRFRLVIPDIIGSSIRSAEVRPPVNDDSYGRWLFDTLDSLQIPRVSLFGVSWGGLVAQRAVQAAPDRVDRLVLCVPGGLSRAGAWDGFMRVGLPLLLYRLRPSPARLHAFVRHQFTTDDADWEAFMGDAVRHVSLDLRLPRDPTPATFAAFPGPVYVFGASDDVHFPGPALLARARTVFPNLVKEELLQGRHVPPTTDAFREEICAKITAFLEDPAFALRAPVSA